VAEIGVGLDGVGLGGLDEGVEIGAGGGSFRGIGKQPIGSAGDEGPDGALGGIIVDGNAAVVEVGDEAGPLAVEVGQRPTGGGFGRHLGQGGVEPGAELGEQGPGVGVAMGAAGFGGKVSGLALDTVEPLDMCKPLVGAAGLGLGALPLGFDGLVELAPGMPSNQHR